jgi:hypothetical protein
MRSPRLPEIQTQEHSPLNLNKKVLIASAFSLAAVPLWAAHSLSTDWSPEQTITIGTTQVQPGQYELKVEEGKSELQVLKKNKVIATVPVHWTKLPAKAHDSEILTDGTKVTEVEFGGRNDAVQINP